MNPMQTIELSSYCSHCRITNGKFASQIHRVINHGKDRHSVAFFVNANYDAVLECLLVGFQLCRQRSNDSMKATGC